MTQTAFPNHAPAMDSHLENSEIGPEAKVIVQEGFYLIFLLFIYFDSLSAKATSHWTREQFYQCLRRSSSLDQEPRGLPPILSSPHKC